MPDYDTYDDSEPSVAIAEQIIIGFDRQLSLISEDEAIKRITSVLDELSKFGVSKLKLFAPKPPTKATFFAIALVQLIGPTLAQLQEELKKASYKDVAYAERNVRIALAGFDDPLLGQQWALRKLGADQPWTVAPPTGGKKVMVALIDSGVRRFDGTVHADMGPVEAGGGVDRDGHGTHLAGVIAGRPGNARGIVSPIPANWGISVLSVRFCGPPYFGAKTSPNAFDAVVAIWNAAFEGFFKGVNMVVNLSWHVAPGDPDSATLAWMIEIATRGFGCVVVVAAGNDGTNNETYPSFPANFGRLPTLLNRVMTVVASDRHDGKASFSNFGRNTADIAAPGMCILTTARYLVDPPRYAEISGTSPAAAFVSAGAALVWALNPGWTADKVVQHLKASADRIATLKLACINGKRLNLKRAVYGPLNVTTPPEGDVVEVDVDTANITWTSAYSNPSLNSVTLSFVASTTLQEYALATVPLTPSTFAWTPKTSDPLPLVRPVAGRIKIKPTTGNFPAYSPEFQLV